jgi:hypothetical protein
MQQLSDRELAAVLASVRKASSTSQQTGLRKLLTMYARVLDAEGYLEAGFLVAFLKETQ